jgi:serine/threonine-protein kinase RsbW
MSEPQWNWVLEECIPSSLDAGHRTIDQLLNALTTWGWDGRDFFHVQMAIEEAMVNAIKHGNKEAADKTVAVQFRIGPSLVWMQLTDQGEGFDPNSLPDPTDEEHLDQPHGRGVMLIRELMTTVSYNERGNQVTMHKVRSTDD